MLQLFQTKKGSFFFIVTLVYSGYIAFPYIMHCIHLSHFFAASSEIFGLIYSVVHSSSQSVSHGNSVFSFIMHCLQMLTIVSDKEGVIFFLRHTCIQWLHSFSLYNALYTLVTLFCCFIRNVLSHIFCCAQLVSVCFSMKLCFYL